MIKTEQIWTMEINYSHPDFKVKGIVDAIPRQQIQKKDATLVTLQKMSLNLLWIG